MLHLRRRHLPSCKHRKSAFLKCPCPLWAVGKLGDQFIRRSLDTRNLERAEELRRDIESGKLKIAGVSVEIAVLKFLADAEIRHRHSTYRKYKYGMEAFKERFKGKQVRAVSVDDLDSYWQSWKLSPSSARKRMELLRGFFSFCVARGWIEANPAKAIKLGSGHSKPAEPFSESEWQKIEWALDSHEELHPKTTANVRQQLRALVLLLRYSGLRISDCISLKRERIDADGRLFVHAIKNQKPVFLPLPKSVLEAIDTADEGNSYLFWNGISTLKTCITEWQERLKQISVDCGIEGRGFAHRCRASFSVELLNKGVPVEMVATILGNSPRIVEAHYSMFVQSRQVSLEAAVKATWA